MGNTELKQRSKRSRSPICEKHNHVMTYGRYSKKAEYREVHKRVNGVLYYCQHCADGVTDALELKQNIRNPLERKKTLAIDELHEGISGISKVMGFRYRIMRHIHTYPNSVELVVFARLGLATRQRIKTVIANLATDLEVMFSDYSGDIISPAGKGIVHSTRFQICDMLTDPTGSTFVFIAGFKKVYNRRGSHTLWAICWTDRGDKVELRISDLAKMVWSGIWKLNGATAA